MTAGQPGARSPHSRRTSQRQGSLCQPINGNWEASPAKRHPKGKSPGSHPLSKNGARKLPLCGLLLDSRLWARNGARNRAANAAAQGGLPVHRYRILQILYGSRYTTTTERNGNQCTSTHAPTHGARGTRKTRETV